MRKTQLEIMGLVIFVILIVVSTAIYLTISSHRTIPRVQEEKTIFTDTLTSSTLKAILNTDTCGEKLRDIIDDCVTLQQAKCSNGTHILDSCTYTEWFINTTLPELLKGYEYEFKVLRDNNEYIVINSSQCGKERYSPSIQVYSLWPMPGNVIITLSLC